MLFIGTSCGQANHSSDSQKTHLQTEVAADTPIQPVQKIAKLDSIEIENNESIIAWDEENITKAYVFLKDGDSTINLTANIRKDHRIFGYARPDTRSERLLLLSVFTNDVENNPFNCKLGAYYETSGMSGLTLKYVSTNGEFVKAIAMDTTDTAVPIYFEKKWIEFL